MNASLILPDFAARSLENVGKLGTFLRASEFPELAASPLFADEPDLASALEQYRVAAAADQGLTTWLRTQIANLHSSTAFDDHAATCRANKPDLQIPRLRNLLPPLPPVVDLRADLYQTLIRTLQDLPDDVQTATVEAILAFYLDQSRFAEALSGQSSNEVLADLFQAQMPAIMPLLDRMAAPSMGDMLLRELVRHGYKYFHKMRSFDRAHVLACLLARPSGSVDNIDPALLDDLWYGAFRLGRLAEAQEWLSLWAKMRPLQKRPLVYRALVTAATDKAEACRLLELAGAADGRSTIPGNVLYAEYSLQQGAAHHAELAIRRACDLVHKTEAGVPPEYMVALHNVLTVQGQETDALQDLFQRSDLRLDWSRFGLDEVKDMTAQPPLTGNARVTVVMTAYNAAAHLRRAAEGVLAQNVAGLTLILVNDSSEDETAEICAALAADKRVLVLQTPHNIGTYAAKNLGIQQALTIGCDYIALCDSDDFWLKPHVARHLAAMEANPAWQCSTSQWIRIRSNGTVECGLRGRYVETCPPSTFFRSDVFERVGFFDEVRFGADREFLNRLALHAGPDSIGEIHALLTLGRRHENSLTQAGAGAISEFHESPLRLEYWHAWNEWHLAELSAGRLPHIKAGAETRPFPVSPEMLIQDRCNL